MYHLTAPPDAAAMTGRLDLVARLIHRRRVELPSAGGRPRRYAILPSIPDDATPALREGLRRRNVATGLGRCPCGAPRIPQPDDGEEISWAECAHEADCPAHDDQLGPAFEAWSEQKLGGRRGAQAR